MCASTGSSSVRASSGSRSAISSIEPLTSANRTVTCLRSPSSTAREVRIFSARCRGVYDPGEPKRGRPPEGPATGCPQSRQNLAAAGNEAPQRSQGTLSGVPQARQNLAPGELSTWHRGHVIKMVGGWAQAGRMTALPVVCVSKSL